MKSETRNTLGYLLRLVLKYKGFVFFRILIGVAGVLSGLFFIMSFRRAVDIATHSASGSLKVQLLLMTLFIVAGIVMSSLSSWFSNTKYVSAGNSLKHDLLSHVVSLDWHLSMKQHTGDIISRLEKDITEVTSFVIGTLPGAVVTLFQLIVYSVYFFTLDYVLAIILMLLIPVGYLAFRKYMKIVLKANREVRKAESRVVMSAEETLRNRTVVKSLSVEEKRLQNFGAEQDAYNRKFVHRTLIGVFGGILMKGGSGLCFLFVFVWGVLRLYNGGITFGTLTAFMQLVSRIQGPAVDLSRLSSSLVSVRTSVERLLELTSGETEKNETPHHLGKEVGLRVRSLSYSYPEDGNRVIDGLDFDLKPGTSIAVVGETGKGKTTLARLILSLVSPDNGEISFYNGSECMAASKATRCNIAYVPQGYSLFAGTIRENLCIVNSRATDDEMVAALKCAAADFVFDNREGLDTRVGEGGGGLSEGQAQRVAIARALLSGGGLLLFDEATSALDDDTEQRVLENIMREYANCTMLFITHSGNVAKKCDHILYL